MARVVRYFLSIAMACAALLGTPAAYALDAGDIVVASVKGEVHVTMKGAERAVRAGSVLELPATVRTGRDGAIELKQGTTSVSVGPDTLLEFPALATRGGPIDRIVQPRGNAFYDIGKRAGRKLRVETPYLVGVVKGTQFNVAAQEDATTISLFEGLLEIRASDDSAVVDIKAGEIAKRGRDGKGIDVIKMDGGKAPPTSRPAGADDGNSSPTTPRLEGADAPAEASLVRGRDEPRPADSVDVIPELLTDPVGDATLPVAATVDLRGETDVAVSLETSDIPNSGATAAVDLNIGTGAPDVAVATATELNAGVANVDLGATANVDLGAGNIDVGAGVAAGPVGVDTAVSAGVDVGAGAASVDVATSTGVNVGNAAAVDIDAGAALDLGAGVAASVGVNAGVDAGPLSTDAGAGVAADLGGGGGAASVDLGAAADVGGAVAVDAGVSADVGAGNGVDVAVGADVGASVAGVDAGVSTGVDVGAGTVDLGVTVGGVDLDVGVDLGLDNNDPGQDTGNTASTPGNDGPGNVVEDVVDTVDGLLNGLLRRPRK